MNAQHTSGPRYDEMDGLGRPMRVLQWATADELAQHLARTGRVIVSERQIGLTLREITIARPAIAKATGSAA